MSTAKRLNLLSVDEYLSAELTSPTKHEYVGGVIYAMAGARNAHNLISTNVLVSLGARLRCTPCRPYNSDTKIRLRLPSEIRFYYPDASVICNPNPQTESFQDQPAVIFEVLSGSTRRIDEGEKRDAYIMIPSLSVYAIIEQEMAGVVAWRRTENGFVREVFNGLVAVLPLKEIGAFLPLSEIYEAVEFQPEAENII